MLDQNTDRMWYVIGAVIIGAAIILIMNKTFPQLFASVGNTFKDKTDDVGKVVEDLTITDGTTPIMPNPNLIPKHGDFRELFSYDGGVYTVETGISVPEWNTTNAAHFQTTGGTTQIKLVRSVDSREWMGEIATASVYIKNLGTSDIVVFSNGVSSVYQTIKPNESTRVVVIGKVRTSYNFVQFRYDTAGASTDLNILLYGHKIELGDNVTPYTP